MILKIKEKLRQSDEVNIIYVLGGGLRVKPYLKEELEKEKIEFNWNEIYFNPRIFSVKKCNTGKIEAFTYSGNIKPNSLTIIVEDQISSGTTLYNTIEYFKKEKIASERIILYIKGDNVFKKGLDGIHFVDVHSFYEKYPNDPRKNIIL